jgi:hypothetical protein
LEACDCFKIKCVSRQMGTPSPTVGHIHMANYFLFSKK